MKKITKNVFFYFIFCSICIKMILKIIYRIYLPAMRIPGRAEVLHLEVLAEVNLTGLGVVGNLICRALLDNLAFE